MAAPSFTPSGTVSQAKRGECIIEMVTVSGANGSHPPTEGQLWPRGNS